MKGSEDKIRGMGASRLRPCVRPVGLLPAVCVVLATVPVAETVTVVAYNGFEYRTRDGASPTATGFGCESNYAFPPSGGWSVSPSNADSSLIGSSYPWHTSVMVWSGGCTGTTQYSGCFGIVLNSDLASGQFKTSGCDARILFRRACAAGSYQDLTRKIYTEENSATCTFCPAGKALSLSPSTTRSSSP